MVADDVAVVSMVAAVVVAELHTTRPPRAPPTRRPSSSGRSPASFSCSVTFSSLVCVRAAQRRQNYFDIDMLDIGASSTKVRQCLFHPRYRYPSRGAYPRVDVAWFEGSSPHVVDVWPNHDRVCVAALSYASVCTQLGLARHSPCCVQHLDGLRNARPAARSVRQQACDPSTNKQKLQAIGKKNSESLKVSCVQNTFFATSIFRIFRGVIPL
jgi:hypothetical protein